jgi:RecJ-like exonuclease
MVGAGWSIYQQHGITVMNKRVVIHNYFPRSKARDAEEKCSRCKGSGSIMVKGMSRPEQCPTCKGTGKPAAKDTWYHSAQINGYYILEGAVGDKGRWLVRNGKYDIVKTASSKSEAIGFAKCHTHGGAKSEAIAADSRARR